MYPGVIAVKPLQGFKLHLTFDNNEKKIFDMNSYLDTGLFSELKDVNFFNAVKVKFDTIEWQNGADLDPEVLYSDSIPVEPKSSSEAVAEEDSPSVRDTEWYAEMRETETSGRNIYAGRMKYQLTQRELGKLIGKSEQYISDLENNRRSPNKETAQKLGEALKRDWRKFI